MESCSRIFRIGSDLQNLLIIITFHKSFKSTKQGALEYKSSFFPLKSPPAIINATEEVGSCMLGKVPSASLNGWLQQPFGVLFGLTQVLPHM